MMSTQRVRPRSASASRVYDWLHQNSEFFQAHNIEFYRRNIGTQYFSFEDKMGPVSRHVDVTNLTEEECRKVLGVISKDILIRRSEKERVEYLNKKFEEFRRTILLANSNVKRRLPFDDYCLICGKHLFTFLCFFHRGEECISCEHFCCPACRRGLILETELKKTGEKTREYFYICKLCIQKRETKSRTAEWFYEAVEKRFKRFGSAKVLRAIYKQRKTIEPRVITLLAICRELQPTKKLSMSHIKRSISSFKNRKSDETSFSGYASSFSDFDSGYERDNGSNRRRRNRSESEADGSLFRQPSWNRGKNKSLRQAISLEEMPRFTSSDINPDIVDESSNTLVKLTIAEEGSKDSFDDVDYLGLFSLVFTVCFVYVLMWLHGCFFRSNKQMISDSKK